MLEHWSIMLPPVSLSTALLLALSTVALPVVVPNSTVTVTISRRLNTSNGTIKILQHDQARVAALKRRSASPLDRRVSFNLPIMNDYFFFVTSVDVGSPQNPTTCKFNLEKKLRLPMDCLTQSTCLSTLVAGTLGLAPEPGTSRPAPVSTRTSLWRLNTMIKIILSSV